MSMTPSAAAAPDLARNPGFAGASPPPTPLRAAIRAGYRTPEPQCVPPLIAAATLDPAMARQVQETARKLVEKLRGRGPSSGAQGMIQEYSLSTEEGVALMCLAEALLRIPDAATRDALIRDKVSRGDWRSHLGPDRTLFVNAATWGLMVTGKLSASIPEEGLSRALGRLISRGGEPIVRTGVDIAMRMMGEQFVAGQTIGEALGNARAIERQGFLHSYDMLGEGAATAEDAARYLKSYEDAIDAIGREAAGRGPIRGPGISIKLSALHPRYRRAQLDRVTAELLPRLKQLSRRAKAYNIGLNIDAEEADRLDMSLDLLEALCLDPQFAGWDGIGFVIQAYGKRCSAVVDWLVDLGRRSGHRLMVRLVKGAYWDSEIKQAQIDGLDGYPVFTRKVYSDVSYIACARKLLVAPAEIFPQFATHNAQTLASIYELAGPDFEVGQYEFQCLHGMGEPLYSQVVGATNLNRPCRIYAPVGTHGTLLAYLVRRLLENGANSSFVNRIADKAVSIDTILADPAESARNIVPPGAPHSQIALPADIFGSRRNSAGLDLSDERELAGLDRVLAAGATRTWTAAPVLADGDGSGTMVTVLNPADHRDIVGSVTFATADLVPRAFAAATPDWAPAAARTKVLRQAADLLQDGIREFIGLMMREAGKSASNAIAEVREAVDFLRYYADQADALPASAVPLGTVVCISPWNFPLSIFTGQVAAALAVGNAVIAKPAEETPLTAAAIIDIFHDAGVPRAALQFLPGAGDIGAALCGHPATAGVVFTGSTDVARLIQKQLAVRGDVPLIAETGGINAMIVDSSALTEQVVADVLSSAFDSAGQRCSALRLLCLQDDIADRTLAMLKGAMQELRVGDPQHLTTDVGPVITADAADRITTHIEAMRAAGHTVTAAPLERTPASGTFVAPTLIELGAISELKLEIFGPVLHVVRYARANLDATVEAINALGYGLTFGLHTRLDETIDRVTARISAGNVYVNRNIIGAVVGVQPFGGHGLSGTGPKAGGPLYLRRLVKGLPQQDAPLRSEGLPGPVGESNVYRTLPRPVLLRHETPEGRARMNALIALAGGGEATQTDSWGGDRQIGAVLVEGSRARLVQIALEVSRWQGGPVVPVYHVDTVDLALLQYEMAISINTAAAGGNASLMALGDGT